ncbi:MarR family transcriptional regulator [Clostridium sp. CX1]|uniref:MarR family winged helix-turn-helix transcriptional regulator n=1 Tax=Clostridium sp. CX1 TaxID=2978346 RepID=UPI0021BE6EF2|nr:MarR family transcriptional regulator [Clostridium sp. CX1]MCT8978627.1 MarR family transcriptional regulator [Clostridium sp. CX1]
MKEEQQFLNDKLREEQVEKIFNINKNIQKNLRVRLEKLAKQYGLTAQQLSVIFKIYETPAITLHELSSHMRLTKSTVSGIVDRLNRQGIIVREIPKDNRRIVNLSISEEFKKNNDIYNIKKKFIKDLVLNSEDNSSINMERIIDGLEEFNLLLKDTDF